MGTNLLLNDSSKIPESKIPQHVCKATAQAMVLLLQNDYWKRNQNPLIFKYQRVENKILSIFFGFS